MNHKVHQGGTKNTEKKQKKTKYEFVVIHYLIN